MSLSLPSHKSKDAGTQPASQPAKLSRPAKASLAGYFVLRARIRTQAVIIQHHSSTICLTLSEQS
jgi:hypothetical protein